MSLERPVEIMVAGEKKASAKAAVLVPVQAKERPDFIFTASIADGDAGKHQLHSLCQMALVDMEDEELGVNEVPDGAELSVISAQGRASTTKGGVVFIESESNRAMVEVHHGVSVGFVVKEAHRYCTRFIRLDVP